MNIEFENTEQFAPQGNTGVMILWASNDKIILN